MTAKNDADKIAAALRARKPRRPPPAHARLSTGCTLLNLAISGHPDWAVAAGHYVWYVGDSGSGKTWFAATMLAEASVNPDFDGHRLIYDDVEHGMLMDVGRYFGPRLAGRLEPPRGTPADPRPSRNVQEFYYNLDDAHRGDRPYVYVLDSMDALDTKQDEKKFLEHKRAYFKKAEENGEKEKAKDPKGTFGMSLPQENSRNIKRYATRLADTGSLMFVVNQTRANVKTSPFDFGPDERPGAGGYALRFYAHVQLWTRTVGRLRWEVGGRKRSYGKIVRIAVMKNRVSGADDVEVTVPFLRHHGIDDVGASVDYLASEGVWEFTNKKQPMEGSIVAPHFDMKLKREALIRQIETDGLEEELSMLVAKTWREIDAATVAPRRNRYD